MGYASPIPVEEFNGLRNVLKQLMECAKVDTMNGDYSNVLVPHELLVQATSVLEDTKYWEEFC